MSEAFLIGGGKVSRLTGAHGSTPKCLDSRFSRGDIVGVRRNKRVGHFPPELIVLAVIPPGFSPDDAMADMLGRRRPLMKEVGARSISYILCRENDPRAYRCFERDLLLKKRGVVEIGEVKTSHD